MKNMKAYFNLNSIKLVITLGVAAILNFSCTEDINLDLDTTYVRLVVDGSISTDTTSHKVILSRSGDPLNRDSIIYVSDAVVTINDGTSEITLAENPLHKGVYETPPTYYGVPGKTYTLNISNVDVNDDGTKETYSASSYLKRMNKIDSIALVYQKFAEEEYGWMVKLYALDAGGRNYYLTKVEKNGVLLTDSIKEFGKAINDGFSGKYYPGFPVYYLSHSKIDERLTVGDTITLVLNCITEDYYNFVDGFQKEYMPKVPIFSGPSSNVITNIEPKEKAVGFFAAYSTQRKSIVFKGGK
jgi:hypothetical protein